MMKALHFQIYYQLDVELLKIIERDDSDKNYPHKIALPYIQYYYAQGYLSTHI